MVIRSGREPAGSRRPSEGLEPPDRLDFKRRRCSGDEEIRNQTGLVCRAATLQVREINGFGYRSRGIETPYLWVLQPIRQGKYVKDGIWDSNAVSRQCGAALLVKELVSRG